jgi:hypothetical protein
MPKLFGLLKSNEKPLVLGPVRVLRRLVPVAGFHAYIVQNNLFRSVVQILVDQGDKYDALNSAILELFQYLIQSKYSCRSLIKYFVENFGDRVRHITYATTFATLAKLYENPEYEVPDLKLAADPLRDKYKRKFVEDGPVYSEEGKETQKRRFDDIKTQSDIGGLNKRSKFLG